MVEEPEAKDKLTVRPHVKPIKLRSRVSIWALVSGVLAAIGLIVTTGLATTPWLFLLYPIFICVIIISLSLLALNLIHRF